jgi:hypothetical protein
MLHRVMSTVLNCIYCTYLQISKESLGELEWGEGLNNALGKDLSALSIGNTENTINNTNGSTTFLSDPPTESISHSDEGTPSS